MIPYRPLRGRVIVSDEPTCEKSRGGIHLPRQARDTPTWGRVEAVGLLNDGTESDLLVGDRVMFGEFSGGTFEDENGKKFRVLGYGEVALVDVRSRGV